MDITKPKLEGFLVVKDKVTNEILLSKHNQIHYENFAIALAKTMADREECWIHEMVFGNGGANVSGTGVVTYLGPNVNGISADLYNPTYSKVVDDNSPLNLNPADNYMVVNHETNKMYSDIVITCTLDYGEPADQSSFDTSSDLEGIYVFDELGLRAYSKTDDPGLLLTHVIFSPIQKSLNRIIEIIYTVRIALC